MASTSFTNFFECCISATSWHATCLSPTQPTVLRLSDDLGPSLSDRFGLGPYRDRVFPAFQRTFQYLTGLQSFPDSQTLRRFLLQAPARLWEQLHRINDRLLQNFIHLPDHRSRLILDLDSTVVTTFGHQDGAEVGYNPRYRGKRSYNPLLCIEANSSYLWDAELRAGNAGTWEGSVELLDTCFANVPPDIREIRARADAGFAFNPVLEALESQPRRYAVVARLTPSPKRSLWPALRARQPRLGDGRVPSIAPTAGAEPVVSWSRGVPSADETQPTLFTLGRYVYRAWVTDLPSDSRRRLAFLRRPRGHGTAHPGTARGFAFANPHSFLCRQCPLPGDYSPGLQPRHRIPANLPATLAILTLPKLRFNLFLLPGEITRPQNRPVLRLHESSHAVSRRIWPTTCAPGHIPQTPPSDDLNSSLSRRIQVSAPDSPLEAGGSPLLQQGERRFSVAERVAFVHWALAPEALLNELLRSQIICWRSNREFHPTTVRLEP